MLTRLAEQRLCQQWRIERRRHQNTIYLGGEKYESWLLMTYQRTYVGGTGNGVSDGGAGRELHFAMMV